MSTRTRTTDIVPLADRMRYMQWLRLTMVAAALLAAGQTSLLHPDGLLILIQVSVGYLILAVIGEVLWRRLRDRGLYLFGIMIVLDGLYLAVVMYETGGLGSVARHLVLVHLIAVTLLASYRTGLKLALWHSLLLLVTYNLEDVGLIPPSAPDAASMVDQLTAFIVTFWLVAIATAMCSAGNERELRRRRYDLEALAVMASRFERVNTPTAVGETLVTSLADSFTLRRVVLYAGSRQLEPLATHGADAVVAPTPRPGSVLAYVCDERRTSLVASLDAAVDRELASALPDATNLLVVPLMADGRAIGVLVAEHGQRHGTRASRRIVSAVERFVSHAALALQNAWLSEEMEALASTDQLTQLPNRRAFEKTAQASLERVLRQGGGLGILLMDIDHFKALNDTHGHQIGDQVLQGVAAAMIDACRSHETVARYGGEEFVVVLPGEDREGALAAAERLRGVVAEADVPVPVTVSIGVAQWGEHGDDMDALIRAADGALYRAKAEGRNRVARAADDCGVTALLEAT